MAAVSKWIIIACCLGITFITLGLLSYLTFPIMFRRIIEKNKILSEESELYSTWKNVPIPIYLEFYFFNVTNPEEVQYQGRKPILQEVGPYRFREKRQKFDITWNNNGTVSYRQSKRWYLESGDLDEIVTTVNVPFISGVELLKNANFLVRFGASRFLRRTELFSIRPVRQLLFEGYFDKVLDMARALKMVSLPSSYFGWFNTKNDTDNGLFTVFTGTTDPEKFGVIDKWNGSSNLTFWKPPCNQIIGTAGEMWPAFQYGDTLSMLITEICRPLSLNYKEDDVVAGIAIRRYVADNKTIDTGSFNKQNKCFCKNECFPPGVMDVSPCNQGLPALVSFPHFLYADPFYLSKLEGLRPDPLKHELSVDIEPTMGFLVSAKAQMQINILVDSDPEISQLSKLEEGIVFPIFWFSQSAEVSEELRERLYMVTQKIPYYVRVASFSLIGLGGLILAVVLIYTYRRQNRWCPKNKKKIHPKVQNLHLTTISNGVAQS